MKYEILDNGIVQISLDNGKANVVSLDLVNQMITLLDKAEEDGKGVLLCGSSGMFSAGFDLKVIASGMDSGATGPTHTGWPTKTGGICVKLLSAWRKEGYAQLLQTKC